MNENFNNSLDIFWQQYKEQFKLPQKEHQEKYKWPVLKQVYDRWDWSRSDKAAMFAQAFEVQGAKNLWSSQNFYPVAHTNWMFRSYPEETEAVFNNLFNESISLESRVDSFVALYDEKLPKRALDTGREIRNHYHSDRRAIALYLSLQYPDKYYLYKYEMYNSFCKKLELPHPVRGRADNFFHFLELCKEVLEFVQEDTEFVEMYRSTFARDDNYTDSSLHLLTQDFIYSTAYYFTDHEVGTVVEGSSDTVRDINYWLYAPGEKARYWEAFYEEGIMGLGWDELGDIARFNSKDDIVKALQQLEQTESSKKNDATANWEFLYGMKPGDVVVVRRGRKELLGYGIVTSGYLFDAERPYHTHYRKVDWKLKGEFKTDHSLAIKTLTRITDYATEHPDFEFYYQRLMAEMGVGQGKKKKTMSINQILYGPPGTGKTFYLKDELFPLYTTKETSLTKDQFFEQKVQELTWWQVLALALIKKNNCKVGELETNRWVSTKAAMSESKNVRATIWGTLQMHTINESTTVGYTQRQAPLIFDKNADKTWTLMEQEAREQTPDLYELLEEINHFNPNPDKLIRRYTFCTFHQSYSYEDFIEGIKPVMAEEGDQGQISYRIQEGVFKEICRKAENDPENRYAIFIDEINRGNVASVFGELITLIEYDKRIGADNEMRLTLPYSRKLFGVPRNLDIYGTMNTADRSVEALDTALRRRFSFVERMPDSSLLEGMDVEGFSLQGLLDTINTRIEVLIDRDHTVGHAYLINVKNMSDLRLAFKDKIIPLLQEYFYGDYGKIGLVLGKGFVDVEVKEETIFSSFDYEGRESLGQTSYTLKSFEDIDFKEALKQLF